MPSEEEFRAQVILLVELAKELGEGKVTSIHVDVLDSGQFPYRLDILEETLPYAGVAISPHHVASQGVPRRSEAGSTAKGGRA